jgi:hypothetical protein
MAITPLPTPPSRDDPTNFATRADAFLGALPDFATEANALAVSVNADAVSADADATAAAASAAAATAAANVTKWVSGTTYTEGAVVWSPTNYLTYRRKTTGGGTTDPSSDSTNWAQAAGTGDVTETGTQALTNKNLSSGTNTFPSTLATLTGVQTLTNKTLTDPAIIGTVVEDVYTITDGAAFEIDPSNGSIQLITLGASRTPKATNFIAGEAITLMIDDGTAYTLTWTDATFGGSGVVWKTDNGSAPTLNTSGYTAVVLWKVNSQVYGARVGNA